MRIDRNAAAIVGHREIAVGRQLDLDEGRMPGQRLVHGIVDGFGEQVMQRLLVGAADVHAGAPPHRLKSLQDLDIMGGVAGIPVASGGAAVSRRGFSRRNGRAFEQIVGRARGLLGGLAHGFPTGSSGSSRER